MNGSINVLTGEKNVIESVSVNGVQIDPVNKSINIPIPTSLPANGGNSDTVNNHTVESSVPPNAVFTDTIYELASESQAGLMSSEDKEKLNGIETGAQVNPTSLPANGGNSDTVNNHTVESSVPPNAVFTDTTYELASESQAGLMSSEDKEKLNGIPDGGMRVYTGALSISPTGGSFKVETSARPKFLMIYPTDLGQSSFNGTGIRSYVEDGSYYMSGNNSLNVHFEDDGITISWTVGTDGRGLVYVVFC